MSDSDGEALSTLGAAGIEYLAATLGRHACTEAMRALALQVAGLECSLHRYTRPSVEPKGARF